MLPLGTKAPGFRLPDVISGNTINLTQMKSSKATVIMFICNHCPYVVHIMDKLVAVATAYQAKEVSFVAISANDIDTYPADSPEKMKALALSNSFSFPYLYDATQEVAKAYHAECTPDFYIFDADLRCQYRGRFDESSPGKKDTPVTGADLTQALDDILAGNPVNADQSPSVGCNIKWKN